MRIEKWVLRTWMLPPVAFMVATTSTPLQAAPAPGSSFVQHNLVSDIPGLAFYTHPGLGNPWGVWFSSQSPFWVSDNGAGLATIYNTFGVKIRSPQLHSRAWHTHFGGNWFCKFNRLWLESGET